MTVKEAKIKHMLITSSLTILTCLNFMHTQKLSSFQMKLLVVLLLWFYIYGNGKSSIELHY